MSLFLSGNRAVCVCVAYFCYLVFFCLWSCRFPPEGGAEQGAHTHKHQHLPFAEVFGTKTEKMFSWQAIREVRIRSHAQKSGAITKFETIRIGRHLPIRTRICAVCTCQLKNSMWVVLVDISTPRR